MLYDREPKEFVITRKLRNDLISEISVGVCHEWCGENDLDERYYLVSKITGERM